MKKYQGFCVPLQPNFKKDKILMKTFEELGVSTEIRQAIEEMGYEHPMPVQEEVIPYLLGENNDVVALAQTGTGKTAAYGLPLIQKVDLGRRVPQSLILCPTREATTPNTSPACACCPCTAARPSKARYAR